ncbi:tyrosine--tRNA ligase [Candidatus Peregrinibacteria bacterium CG_4_10_14_0_2_um_filter_38_24]|nr:MAG: tyrosine--tRNA ligase [Candidatus Peregrinibacteria bacterium CG_4_10_14_0_2_um_filter_38_24]PJC38917.1 MAG: tyrosine--tRNA ligase [Candidatus Peregrinibacteria bacterium CG_4_9_14_0_2_um_filter_38_9]
MAKDNKNLLERGVVEVIVKEELEKKLNSGKKLRIKFGIDPTGSDLHIGHGVVLRKLKQFQDRGDTAILLIGDYTARIGDPTGKSETRKTLTEEQIKENMKHYIEQASKILDLKKLEIRYNSEWFGKMNMAQILELTTKRTVSQMLQREDFKNRLKNNQDISVTELLYPLMQGYDSVMLESDVELGGTDQTFNMLVGRDMQKNYGCKTIQDIITVPILEGTDGIEKMSKTYNNYIGFSESPKEIYGKAMSIPDNMIIKYFELATEISFEDLKTIEKALKQGENPKNLKMRLARELVALYHDKKSAETAEKEFTEIFSNKGKPEEIEKIKLSGKIHKLVDLLVETKLTTSKGEARRLIEQGGLKVDDEKIIDINAELDTSKERLIQAGKRKFIKVIGK